MMTGDPHRALGESAHEARAVPPALIALGGALVAGICLLLLLGPFYPEHAAPADHMQRWLMMLLDGRGPFVLQRLLRFQFPLLLILLFGTVLVLVPWRRAVHLRRERLGAGPVSRKPASRQQRTTTRSAPRGASAVSGAESAERRSVAELGEMARAAGIRWHPEYATEGGARGLLEILRALENGVDPADLSQPATAPWAGAGAGIGPSGFAAAPPSAPATTDAEEPADSDAEEPTRPTWSPSSSPTWSPSYSGSVYTPTVLYGTEREDAAPADPEGSDTDGTPEDGRTER